MFVFTFVQEIGHTCLGTYILLIFSVWWQCFPVSPSACIGCSAGLPAVQRCFGGDHKPLSSGANLGGCQNEDMPVTNSAHHFFIKTCPPLIKAHHHILSILTNHHPTNIAHVQNKASHTIIMQVLWYPTQKNMTDEGNSPHIKIVHFRITLSDIIMHYSIDDMSTWGVRYCFLGHLCILLGV